MKLKQLSVGALCLVLFAGLSSTVVAKEPPVAKLVQVKGMVEYSRNSVTWRKVRRTKYLFPGYRIRTGRDGSGKLISQLDGTTQDLGAESEILISDGQVTLVSGSLSEAKKQSTSIFQGLANKFAKAQRYTTVRRGIRRDVCDPKVRTVRNITLSESHPDLVWRNACPEYSYKLTIQDTAYDISGRSTSEMIRFKVTGLKPGTYDYRVEVLDIDGAVFVPRRNSQLTWLSRSDEKKILKQVKSVEDDILEVTNLLESQGLLVAAMDAYRVYFAENPDDNDMRPLLVESYNDLKLSRLKDSEARLYNASLENDF